MSSRRMVALLATASVVALASTGAVAQTAATDQVEAVVVTGSRLTTGFTTPTPVTVLGADQIQQRAANSLTEIFNQTPAFTVSGPERGGTGTQSPGTASPNLRNLGSARTLQLVNGRRTIPTDQGTLTSDTNIIPTSMVERVEVTTGGASAAYGSDAVAGVVNIILKRRMTDIQGNVTTGISQYGDARRYEVSIAGGRDFAGGKGNIMLGGQLQRDSGVFLKDRTYDEATLNSLQNTAWTANGLNGPRNVYAVNTVPAYTTGGTVVTPGVLQGMSFNTNGSVYTLNKGLNWTATGSMQLQPGNTQNLGYQPARAGSAATRNTRRSAVVQVGYDFTDNVHGFLEGNYGQYWTYAHSMVNPAVGIIVEADNPYAPAALVAAINANAATLPKDGNGKPFVTVAKDMSMIGGPLTGSGFGQTQYNSEYSYKYTTGLEGTIGDTWKWDLVYLGGLGRYHIKRDGFWAPANFYQAVYAVKDASGNIVCGPIQTNPMLPHVGPSGPIVRDDSTGRVKSGGGTASGQGSLTLPGQLNTIQSGCVPFNPFGELANSDAARDYVNMIIDEDVYTTRRNIVDADISGELFDLPAGPVSFALGGEWRRDTFRVAPIGRAHDGQTLAFLHANNSAWAGNPTAGYGQATTREAYAEVGVPVLKDLPFIKTLDLNGAVRRTNYSTTGSVNTWKVGGTWDVNDWLRFRGVRSRDIRSPNLSELFITGITGFFTGVNKFTGQSQAITSQTRPNSSLQSEIAKTTSFGFVLQPDDGLFERLRFSADYYKIVINGFIGGYPGGAQGVMDAYFLPCNSTQFGTQGLSQGCGGKSAVDGSPIAPYVVTDSSTFGVAQIFVPSVNLAQQIVEGYDFAVAYPLPRDLLDMAHVPGTLQLQANMQWMVTLGQRTPDAKTGQLVPTATGNQAGSGYSPIRLNAGFQYNQGPFTFGGQMNYFSGYRLTNTLIGPEDPGYSTTLGNSVNINHVGGDYLFGLNTAYVLRDTGARRMEVYGVVSNLLNNLPDPIDVGLVDGIGRAFRVGIRFKY